VAALPGSDFGRPLGELSMRLAYVKFDGGAALSGIDYLQTQELVPDEAFIQAYCAPLMEGVECLATWIERL
jgi:aspartate aminotransferase